MQNAQDLNQAQTERTERARTAIRAGQFLVTRINPQEWTVKNGDKQPYVVSLVPRESNSNSDPVGMDWTCTCMDFQQRGPAILCKHIEGVRLLEAAQPVSSSTPYKETAMNESLPTSDGKPEGRLNRILWELTQPLDMTRVKRRQAPGMGSVPYLEGYDVIERANRIFEFAWSFDLVGEPVIVRWQKKVLVWNQQEKRKVPALDANGIPQTEDAGLVYVTGKVTLDLGGQLYSHADLGRCVFSGDTPEALDMALAGSVTDCLKRCFRQAGEQFGNMLYDKDIAQNAGLEQKSPNGSNGSSSKASHTPPSTSPATPVARKYGDGSSVNGNPSEQEAYDQFKEKTGKAPASKDDLRSWLASHRSVPAPVPTAA